MSLSVSPGSPAKYANLQPVDLPAWLVHTAGCGWYGACQWLGNHIAMNNNLNSNLLLAGVKFRLSIMKWLRGDYLVVWVQFQTLAHYHRASSLHTCCMSAAGFQEMTPLYSLLERLSTPNVWFKNWRLTKVWFLILLRLMIGLLLYTSILDSARMFNIESISHVEYTRELLSLR